jgi:hypothetical protein
MGALTVYVVPAAAGRIPLSAAPLRSIFRLSQTAPAPALPITAYE